MPVRQRVRSRVTSALLRPASYYNGTFAYMAQLDMALARGALNAVTRHLDPARPSTWEFSSFSQNGEDGVIDYLVSLIAAPTRYFVEIGASDGLENNSAYLAFAKKYSGMMVEGDAFKSGCASKLLQPLNGAVDYVNLFVELDNVRELLDRCLYPSPDLFSLDIDGNDYHIARAFLAAGFRPKVVCVEYNSALGPDKALTIPYSTGFECSQFHASQLYYGVSVRGWRVLLERYGYRFVTVETRGVNAFFIDPEAVSLPDAPEPLEFAENAMQLHRLRTDWRGQFELVQHLPYVDLEADDCPR
jgi:hypothetical protein